MEVSAKLVLPGTNPFSWLCFTGMPWMRRKKIIFKTRVPKCLYLLSSNLLGSDLHLIKFFCTLWRRCTECAMYNSSCVTLYVLHIETAIPDYYSTKFPSFPGKIPSFLLKWRSLHSHLIMCKRQPSTATQFTNQHHCTALWFCPFWCCCALWTPTHTPDCPLWRGKNISWAVLLSVLPDQI